MRLERLRDKCDRLAWSIQDLDLSAPPPPLSAENEEAVVQYFTDMVALERMAGGFFHALRSKVKDPVAVEVLDRFVEEEIRHAQAMQLLADRYDQRHLRIYSVHPHLLRTIRLLLDWIALAPPDIAAAAVLCGELIFDVAYLDPIEGHLDDPVASQVLQLVHRDEARHIALDYYLMDHYGSSEGKRELAAEPKPSRLRRARLTARFGRAFVSGFPFMRTVFFGRNRRVDPDGRAIRTAAKRLQLAFERRSMEGRWYQQFYRAFTQLLNDPVTGPVARRLLAVIFGADETFFRTQYSAEERAQHRAASAMDAAAETIRTFYDGDVSAAVG